MKAAVWKSILFVLVLALCYSLFDFIVIFGVSHSRRNQLGKVNAICAHTDIPGVAIFGSSVGDVGINSLLMQRKTGLSVYNYSLNGSMFAQYEGLIDEFGEKNEKTKFVILAETYFSFTRPSEIFQPERYLAQLSNPNVFRSLYAIKPGFIWKCRYVPFYKYTAVSHEFYLTSADGWRHFFAKKIPDTALGYNPVFQTWQPDQDSVIAHMDPFKISVDPGIAMRYKNCIRKLTKNGMRVIIVVPPIYLTVLKSKTDFGDLRRSLREIASETGAVFWDFTTSPICDQKALFYNSIHVNNVGAYQFSQALSDSLNRIKGL